MTTVPLKKAVTFSYVKPLSSYIQGTMGLNAEDFQPAIEELDRLREESNRTQNIVKLFQYLSQVRRLPSRFPLGDDLDTGSGSAGGLKIPFSWHSAIDSTNAKITPPPFTSHNPLYEEAAIMFNIGACYSQQARTESAKGNQDALKRACHLYVQAARSFSEIGRRYAELIEGQLPAGCELSRATTTALSLLMIAQAQECVLLKAENPDSAAGGTTVKEGTLAKISKSLSGMFGDAQGALMVCPGVIAHGEAAGLKALYYGAKAHLLKSAELHKAMEYGKELYKLQEAERNAIDLQSALEASQKSAAKSKASITATTILTPSFASQVSSLMKRIKDELQRARHDNQMIYNEVIPTFPGPWAECGAAVLVNLPEGGGSGGGAAFPSDPEMVRALEETVFLLEALPSRTFRLRLDEAVQERGLLLQEMQGRVDECERQLDDLFVRYELSETVSEYGGSTEASASSPTAAAAASEEPIIPVLLLQRSKEVIAEGGYGALETWRENLDRQRRDCLKALAENRSALDAEEVEDLDARSRFHASVWNRPLSSQLNAPLRRRLEEIQTAMDKAVAADESAQSAFDAHIPGIITLCSNSQQELCEAIPGAMQMLLQNDFSSGVGGGREEDEPQRELRRLLPAKGHLQQHGRQLIEQAGKALDSIDYTAYLSSTSSSSNEERGATGNQDCRALFHQMELVLGPIKADLSTYEEDVREYARQIEAVTMEARNQANIRMAAAAAAAEASEASAAAQKALAAERSAVLQSLNEAYEAFKFIQRQLQAGNQFYGNVLKELDELKRRISEFAVQRKTEAASLRQTISDQQSQSQSQSAYYQQQPPHSAAAPGPMYNYGGGGGGGGIGGPVVPPSPTQSGSSAPPHWFHQSPPPQPQPQYQYHHQPQTPLPPPPTAPGYYHHQMPPYAPPPPPGAGSTTGGGYYQGAMPSYPGPHPSAHHPAGPSSPNDSNSNSNDSNWYSYQHHHPQQPPYN